MENYDMEDWVSQWQPNSYPTLSSKVSTIIK